MNDKKYREMEITKEGKNVISFFDSEGEPFPPHYFILMEKKRKLKSTWSKGHFLLSPAERVNAINHCIDSGYIK